MIIHEGYKDIKVKLLNFDEQLAYHAYMFGRFGSDHYYFPTEEPNEAGVKDFIDEIKKGITFPKYAVEGTRIDFQIEGISRICLAQLTRDNAIFCSESHGLRPLTMDFNMPLNLYDDKDIMKLFEEAQSLLEQAYILACEREIPYPESRYLGLHCQTISVNCSFTPAAFARACFSRTNNSFCDELNYVYRKMFFALKMAIETCQYDSDKELWHWLINSQKCIDDSYYKRTNVFNGDFNWTDTPIGPYKDVPAMNDWRKSCWPLELIRIYDEEPYLLTDKEIRLVKGMKESLNTLPTSYNEGNPRVAKNAIKSTDYYIAHNSEDEE